MKLHQLCRTVLRSHTDTYSEMLLPERNSSTMKPYMSKCDNVVITKNMKSFSNHKSYMGGEVRAILLVKKSCLSVK